MSAEKLILFAPLPPKQNGIADYVAEQLLFHARHAHTVVVIDNSDPDPIGIPASVTVLRMSEYLANRDQLMRYPHVYHVGNNPDHGYLLPVLYSTPGLVIVHDLGLHHLTDTQTLELGNREGYAWAIRQQYGRLGRVLGDQFLELGWKGKLMPQELLLNGAVLGSAEHIIVHSEYSAESIRSEYKRTPVTVVPHHLSPAVRRYNPARRRQARAALQLPEDGLILTSLGFINHHKQIESVLAALAELRAAGQEFTYVLAGRCRKEEYDVYQHISRYGLDDCVKITGYLDEDAFFKHVVAADIIVNLRYPSGGETSGTMTRALGMGRCCVVVNIGPFAEIPDTCAVKIDWGNAFRSDLSAWLRRLIDDPELRTLYEVNARDWCTSTHAIQETTRQYHDIIDSLSSAERKPVMLGALGTRTQCFTDEIEVESWMMSKTDVLEASVRDGAGHLWWRESLVPVMEPDGDGLLLVSDSRAATALLKDLLGYPDESIRYEDSAAYSAAGFAQGKEDDRRENRILAVVPLSTVCHDPVLFTGNLSGAMAIGGELTLSLRYDLDSAGQESEFAQTVSAWRDYLDAAGFEVLDYYEAPSSMTYSAFESLSVEWVFRARKLTDRVDRHPKPYYAAYPTSHLALTSLDMLPSLPEESTSA